MASLSTPKLLSSSDIVESDTPNLRSSSLSIRDIIFFELSILSSTIESRRPFLSPRLRLCICSMGSKGSSSVYLKDSRYLANISSSCAARNIMSMSSSTCSVSVGVVTTKSLCGLAVLYTLSKVSDIAFDS